MPKEALDNLPSNENKKFWRDAEVEVIELKEPKECEHFFIHRSSQEVECRKCHVGYYLSIGDRVQNGHIYHYEKLVF